MDSCTDGNCGMAKLVCILYIISVFFAISSLLHSFLCVLFVYFFSFFIGFFILLFCFDLFDVLIN